MGEIIDFPGFNRQNEAAEKNKPEERLSRGERLNYNKLTELLNLVTGLMSQTKGNPRGETYRDMCRLVNSAKFIMR